eukprot:TRINITY_DN10268_c0_g4_i4.p2 TRINITY_DN10268_c0_g4~~TRINITY_DN10268_c0_g4_i4.p2  ORF type:complete len:172 (+),score=29.84 TRINITY_DN10268_c0_g4_i4:76-591(+)
MCIRDSDSTSQIKRQWNLKEAFTESTSVLCVRQPAAASCTSASSLSHCSVLLIPALGVLSGSILLHAHLEYSHSSTVIRSALQDQLNAALQGSADIKDAIRPQDIVAFNFYYRKEDAVREREEFRESGGRYNFTQASLNMEMFRYGTFKKFTYSQKYYVLKLPDATKSAFT